MIHAIAQYGILYLAAIVAMSVLGHGLYLMLCPAISGNHARSFVKLGLGLFIPTTIYAIVLTKAESILCLFILILVILFRERVLRFKLPTKKELFGSNQAFFFLQVFLPYLLFFVWEGLFYFKTGDFHYVSPPSDYHHYSEISASLSVNQQENIFGFKNDLMPLYQGTTPYHYVELWLNNLLSTVSGLSSIGVLMVVTFPLLLNLTYQGFAAILERYNFKGIKLSLIALLLVALGGVFLNFYSSIPYLGSGQLLCVIPTDTYFRKYIIYYPFVIGFWLLFERKQWTQAFVLLNGLVVISAGVLPGLVSGVGAFTIYALLFKRENKKELVRASAYTLILAMVWFLFYAFTANKNIAVNNLAELTAIETWKKASTYKTILNVYVLTSMQYLLNFLPFVLLLVWLNKKALKRFFSISKLPHHFTWIALLFFSSLSCWAFLHLTGNARQFFSNAFAVVFVVWLSIELIKRIKYSGYIVVFIVLGCGYNWALSYSNNTKTKLVTNSDAYMNQIKLAIGKSSDVVHGGILFSQEETNHITQRRDKAFHIYPLAHYTNLFQAKVDVHNLSVFDAPKLNDETKEKRFKHLIEITPFFQFVKHQKTQNQFSSYQESLASFVQVFELKFVVLRKGVELPQLLRNRVQRTIVDESSGDRFILLN